MTKKKTFPPFSWTVKNYDCNKNIITDYDILKYREKDIKKMKKKCENKREFSILLQKEMMYYFWSKAEYELIMEKINDRIYLTPWCGCSNPDEIKIDVTDDNTLDWKGFFDFQKQTWNLSEFKIDIYQQLLYDWDNFLNYCWNFRHKWQRTKKIKEV